MANLFDRANYPTAIPEKLIAGERWLWQRDLSSDYDVASYSLKYSLRLHSGGGSGEINITAVEASDTYYIEVPSSTTVGYSLGHWHWQEWIVRTSDSERILLAEGHVEILGDYDYSNADPRTHAELMLDKIQSLLEGRADSDVSEYSIGDRSLTKLSFKELLQAEKDYRARVHQEHLKMNAESGKRPANRVLVRF